MHALTRVRSRLLLLSAIVACALAVPWAFLTQLQTDPGWNQSIWSESGWRSIAWGLTAVGALAAATAFGYAYAERVDGDRRQRRAALAALAVYVLAGAVWLAGALLAVHWQLGS